MINIVPKLFNYRVKGTIFTIHRLISSTKAYIERNVKYSVYDKDKCSLFHIFKHNASILGYF